MRTLVLALLVVAPVLAGCIADGEDPPATPTDQDEIDLAQRGATGALIANVSDGADPADIERLLATNGTYFSTQHSTFEPTIGITSSGAIFTTSYRGLGAGTRIIRSTDQAQNWEDVTPKLPTGTKMVPNSNDPFLYVDPFTDRVYDFDMCVILQGFCVAYSDDDGDTWTHAGIAHGYQPALDHQSMAAAPDRSGFATGDYPNALTYCVNRGFGFVGPWCSSSFDGGFTWTPLVPGYPVGTPQCSGLHGHVEGAADGTFYRGNPACDGPAVYRSDDGGLSWSEHVITTEVGSQAHEIDVAIDDDGNVYAFWIGDDGLPYLAMSSDNAETWGEPIQVGAPGVTAAGFPAVAAGAGGSVAWTYIGTDVEGGYDGDVESMKWTGYIGFSLDMDGNATIANVPVNAADDPLEEGNPCGRIRCGGFGDFVSMAIDPDGRPWAALAHNGADTGIVGTFASGPSLRGDGDLPMLWPGPKLSSEE